MKTPKVSASLILAVLLVGVAGCGSGGGSNAPSSSSAPTTSSSSSPSASMSMGSSPAATTTSTSSGTATAPAQQTADTITIKDFDYGSPITVAPGATVTVKNMDTASHTVTADQGSAFDVTIQGDGGTATFTAPSQPGTYAFHCTFHPNMHGTLTVQ